MVEEAALNGELVERYNKWLVGMEYCYRWFAGIKAQPMTNDQICDQLIIWGTD
jgi:hypothetical protein